MSQAQNETALESMENSELLTGSMGKLFWKYALSALVGGDGLLHRSNIRWIFHG